MNKFTIFLWSLLSGLFLGACGVAYVAEKSERDLYRRINQQDDDICNLEGRLDAALAELKVHREIEEIPV